MHLQAQASQPDSTKLSKQPSISNDTNVHNTTFGAWVEVGERCILNNVEIGDYSYIQNDCDLMFTKLGKFCSIASHVRINPSNHPYWRPTLHHFTYRPGKFGFSEDNIDQEVFEWRAGDKVTIGHDVWIGHGAIILPGVNIGNGAIVGAGSIVTKDVSAWSIVVGNPAKFLRFRFQDESIGAKLERIAWWDWNDEKIKENLKLFQKDAKEFVEHFDI
ncbi:DapH/DapD/GlmU-related protein [Desulfovibrio litoralis]|uniref:Phosphonate metabolim protein, transferase hexapeptide repeat family n=1 Tax=Desulfovibrio litoralis DSM 11393 TaxID=1121455 RepID=A0A1M7SSU8_9BACT|nr:DapH/DapD/GlmU-related protein [Desulfovibrio litoralis]SHN61456.1 hypothetical protein SAMN02745728_01225 [Desulfovibrio litoralis DSM 11393]